MVSFVKLEFHPGYVVFISYDYSNGTYFIVTHITTVAMITRTTAARTTMMIMVVSVFSCVVKTVGLMVGVVGLAAAGSPTKTIAVIPSTWLEYSSSLPCENEYTSFIKTKKIANCAHIH